MADPAAFTAALDEQGLPIPAAQLRERVEAGKWRMAAGGQISMIGPEGETKLFDEAGARTAVQQGWFPEPFEQQRERALDAKYGGIGQALIAGGEAAIESVPFAGPALLGATESEADRLAREQRAERHPVARGVGMVGGIGAQLLATGFLGAAARGAAGAAKIAEVGEAATTGARVLEAGEALAGATRALPVSIPRAAPAISEAASGIPSIEAAGQLLTAPWRATVAAPGRAVGGSAERALAGAGASEKAAAFGGRVAQMGTEGASLGLSSQLAEDQLHATPVRAEHLANAAGMGLLMGVGFEAGLGGLGYAGRKLLSSEALERTANKAAYAATRARPSETVKLTRPGETLEDTTQRLGKRLREEEVVTFGRKNEAMVEPAIEAKARALGRLESLENEIVATTKGRPELSPNVPRILERAETEIIKPLEDSMLPATREHAARIRADIADLKARYVQSTTGELVPHVATAEERQVAQQTIQTLGKFGEVWRKNAQELGDTLSKDGIDEFSKKFVGVMKEAKVNIPAGVDIVQLQKTIEGSSKRFGAMMSKDFDGFVASTSESFGGPPSIQKFDRIMGPPPSFEEVLRLKRDLQKEVFPRRAEGQGLPPPAPPSQEQKIHLFEILKQELEDTGDRVLQSTGGDPGLWKAVNKDVSDWINLKKIIEKSAGHTQGHRLFSLSDTIHGVGSGAAFGIGHGLAWSVAHKALRERGQSMLASASGRLAEILRGVEARNTVSARVIGLGKSAAEAAPLAAIYAISRTPTGQTIRKEDIPDLVSSLREFDQLKPSVQREQAKATLGDFAWTHPLQAEMAAEAMVRQSKYLAGKLPEPVRLMGVRPKEMLDPVASAKFENILHAVANPVGLFEDVSRGLVPSVDAIEAVKATSPAMFDRMRQEVETALRDRTEEVSPADARLLNAVFGIVVSPETDPEIGARAQLVIGELQKQADQKKQQEQQMAKAAAPDVATRSQELEKGRTV